MTYKKVWAVLKDGPITHTPSHTPPRTPSSTHKTPQVPPLNATLTAPPRVRSRAKCKENSYIQQTASPKLRCGTEQRAARYHRQY
jgi:hypothetical protein